MGGTKVLLRGPPPVLLLEALNRRDDLLSAPRTLLPTSFQATEGRLVKGRTVLMSALGVAAVKLTGGKGFAAISPDD